MNGILSYLQGWEGPVTYLTGIEKGVGRENLHPHLGPRSSGRRIRDALHRARGASLTIDMKGGGWL